MLFRKCDPRLQNAKVAEPDTDFEPANLPVFSGLLCI